MWEEKPADAREGEARRWERRFQEGRSLEEALRVLLGTRREGKGS